MISYSRCSYQGQFAFHMTGMWSDSKRLLLSFLASSLFFCHNTDVKCFHKWHHVRVFHWTRVNCYPCLQVCLKMCFIKVIRAGMAVPLIIICRKCHLSQHWAVMDDISQEAYTKEQTAQNTEGLSSVVDVKSCSNQWSFLVPVKADCQQVSWLSAA